MEIAMSQEHDPSCAALGLQRGEQCSVPRIIGLRRSEDGQIVAIWDDDVERITADSVNTRLHELIEMAKAASPYDGFQIGIVLYLDEIEVQRRDTSPRQNPVRRKTERTD